MDTLRQKNSKLVMKTKNFEPYLNTNSNYFVCRHPDFKGVVIQILDLGINEKEELEFIWDVVTEHSTRAALTDPEMQELTQLVQEYVTKFIIEIIKYEQSREDNSKTPQ